jgi:DNA mismatch repair protein MutS2
VREVRGGRYAIDIKGRIVIAPEGDLEIASGKRPRREVPRSRPREAVSLSRPVSGAPPSLDLHGKTADEAVAALEAFVNDALLAGHGEARVIHGRSGGRVKAAVHRFLRELASVASFRVDPRNPGVTIVSFV